MFEHDCKLVAAEASDGVAVARELAQAASELADQQVSSLVPERVVDVLEPIEVEHENGDVHVPPAQRMLQAVLEQGPVGQAGKNVVKRQMLRLGLALFEVPAAAPDAPQQQSNPCSDRDQDGEQDGAHLALD